MCKNPSRNTLKICVLHCMLYIEKQNERKRTDVCGHCLQVSVKWTYFMGLKNPRGSFLSLFHLFIWPVCRSGCIRLPVIPVARGIGGWGWESDQGRTQGAWAPWLRKAGSWLTLPGRHRTWKPDDKVLKVFTPCLEWHRPCPLVLEAESSSLRLGGYGPTLVPWPGCSVTGGARWLCVNASLNEWVLLSAMWLSSPQTEGQSSHKKLLTSSK